MVKIIKYWIVLIIPLIFLGFSLLLKSATGPYWQYPDPSFGHLLSSLTLIKGLSPTFNYQPGITIQILGAMVISVLNIGHSTAQIVRQVLLNPDLYLNAINSAILMVAFLTSLILGHYIYRQTNDKIAVLLSQLPVLATLPLRSFSFYHYILPIVANVSPEPLLISISNIFNLYILKLYFAKNKRKERSASILLGLTCGFGIATKLTFFPALLLPLIVCRGWLRVIFLSATAISFVFWTIPIFPSYPWLWDWIVKLTTHKGGYGSGDQGIINVPLYIACLHDMFNICMPLIYFALGALLFSFWQIFRKLTNKGTFFIIAIAINILAQFAFIAKDYDPHYLVSTLCFFGPLFVLPIINFSNKNMLFRSVILGGIILIGFQFLGQAMGYQKELSVHTREVLSFNQMLHTKYPDCVFVGIYPMPMAIPEAAFFWGNDRDNTQQDELSKLYPRNLAYFSGNVNDHAPYLSGIYSIKDRVWADDLIASGSHILFIGPKGYDFSSTPYAVRLMEEGKYASAFLLEGSTEKRANILFDAAFNLAQTGDYKNAFAFANTSQQLHYQPEDKITYLQVWLYLHLK